MISRSIPELRPEAFLELEHADLTGTPAIAGDLVAVVTAGSVAPPELRGLDATTGQWRFALRLAAGPSLLSRRISSPFLTPGGRIVLAAHDPLAGLTVRRFAADGRRLAGWGVDGEFLVPVLDFSLRVLAASSTGAVVEWAGTGAERECGTRVYAAQGARARWSKDAPCAGVWKDVVVLATRSRASLYGFSRDDGTERWHRALFPATAHARKPLARAFAGPDGILAVNPLGNPRVATRSDFFVLDPSTGETRTESSVDFVITDAAVAPHVTVIAGRDDEQRPIVQTLAPNGSPIAATRGHGAPTQTPPRILAVDHTRALLEVEGALIAILLAEPGAHDWRLPIPPGTETAVDAGVLVLREPGRLRLLRG